MNLPKCPMQSKQRHQTKCRNMLPPHGQMTIGELGLDFVIMWLEVHNLAVIVATTSVGRVLSTWSLWGKL